MEKIVIIFLLISSLIADNFEKLIDKKTNALHFTKPTFTIPTNQEELSNQIIKIVKLNGELKALPSKIEDIQNKIELLNSNKDKELKKYYQKLLEIYNKKLLFLNQNLPTIEKTFYENIKHIKFNISQIQSNIKYLKKELSLTKKEYEKLNIALQKYSLLEDEKNISKTKKKIQENISNQKTIALKLIKNYSILWLYYLNKKDKKAFEIEKEILKYSSLINESFYKAFQKIITKFDHYTFGSKLLIYNTKNEILLTLEKIKAIINYPLFTISNKTITPFNFAIFLIVLIVGWFIGKYYKKFIYNLKRKAEISHSTATLLANMGYYTIITLSFLTALKVVGLDLSSLALIAGALSVGIGFGLQNIVSNFVSGIILMFERSIKVGDYIQIDENTKGEVTDISMRSTIIRTNDNINLIIPNQSFIQNNVINWTLGDDIIRFRVPFGVAYGSDIDKVENVVLGALSNSNLPYIKKHPSLDVTPKVIFIEMGDSSLNFELFVWVKGIDARRPRITRSKFLKMIYNALNKAGIEIPFPQQDLHIKDSIPLQINIKKD